MNWLHCACNGRGLGIISGTYSNAVRSSLCTSSSSVVGASIDFPFGLLVKYSSSFTCTDIQSKPCAVPLVSV